MKLTRNEKNTLKLLLRNARQSDSAIASELGISSQAVGKIRKKLEKNIINSYTVSLPYEKIGIKTFAISFSKLTEKGQKRGEIEIEQLISNNSHVIQLCRVPSVKNSYIITYGFTDTEEMDRFFESKENKEKIFKYVENSNVFIISHNSYLKHDTSELICKKIDALV